MHTKTSLFRGAAFGAMIAIGAGVSAQAATVHHKKVVHKKAAHVAAAKTPSELSALRAEVRELTARLDAQAATQAETQAQVQQANAAAQSAQAQVQTAQAQDADATAAIIQSIPVAVAAEIDKVKPKTDGIYFKGVKITPGGFIEAANVYREHNTANDISTGLNTIPFPQTRQGHTESDLFTPRQSRVSALVEGKPTADITLSMYGEFDFQGAAQSANSNESNSYNPRIRHLYASIDWADTGWHFLAGQTWSLVTLNSKGITPRNEVTPLTIDGQYTAGFDWTRQPQVRVTKDFLNKTIWIAASAENPQTTFTGTVPAGVINTINNGQGFFGGTTGTLATTTSNGNVTAVSGVATATQSLNHVPDFVVKAAAEEDIAGHHVHAEVYGMARTFSDQLATMKTDSITTGAFGGGIIAQVIPGWFDFQASALNGKGIGRYGSAQLPDVTFNTNGHIEPIEETIALLGGTVHATKDLDVWVYGGEEHESRAAYGTIGYGNPSFVNTGCGTEASTLTCTGNTKMLEELSGGFWQKLYSGPWGQARIGLQYSYVDRVAFSGVGGAPTAHDNMIFTSFRYYPFQ
ncbi:hypothetical protein [Caulobacter sp. S45]|uniref:hypothetical protein n=1 Tax=Caulobacter sp. S45 TaxID=1641861 RepID=UPI00131BB2BF|nr:hypothetical protein [Caulobacter sp. S45]